MSDRPRVPYFESSGQASGQPTERRQRLLMLAGGALVLALLVSSVANATRASLRCIDGALVPHRGRLLPVGEEPLEDDAYPPLPVSMATCEDEQFEDRSSFEQRYVELAFGQAEPTLNSGGQLAAESAIEAIEAMAELPTGASEELQNRRLSLFEAVVRQKVEHAQQSEQDAVRWIERARRAGVDPALLRAAERSLGVVPETGPEPAPEPEPATESAPRLQPMPDDPPSARAL